MTFSYCGQQQEKKQQYQQVYSLPIVMNEEEWELSSIEDKSFVLIYNTALCNHLLGMNLLVTIRDYNQDQEAGKHYIKSNIKDYGRKNSRLKQNKNKNKRAAINKTTKTNNINTLSNTCERAFHVAKNLYRLALENVISFVNGVDQLCYVAMFNNMSHVYKTLQGFNSQEASRFDLLLLKAIFWWKDTNSFKLLSSSSTSSATSTQSNNISLPLSYQDQEDTTTTTTTTMPSSSGSSSNHNNASNNSCYEDDDLEIIDSFLENVFYLVGVPYAIVPAPAA